MERNLNLETIVSKARAGIVAGVRNVRENAIGYTFTGLFIGALAGGITDCINTVYIEPYSAGHIRQLSEKAGYQNPEDVKKAARYDDMVYGIALELRDGSVLCFESYAHPSERQQYALARSFSKHDAKSSRGCEDAVGTR